MVVKLPVSPPMLQGRWRGVATLASAIVITACSTEAGNQAAPDTAANVASPSVPGTPAPVPSPTAVATADTAPRLTVDGEGLRWFLQPGGSARPVAFGAAQADVLDGVQAVRGRVTLTTNQDCGAGPVQFATWDDGLSLLFQEGKFVGWGLDTRASGKVATAAGVGPGTTRAELAAAYDAEISETTLGTEFAAGDLYGLFDGPSAKARITDMWAGVSCFAR